MRKFNRNTRSERSNFSRSGVENTKNFGKKGPDDKPQKGFSRGTSDRFEKKDFNKPERKSFDRRAPERQGFDKKMFSAVCDSCGNRCELPFKPTGDKPVYCRDCFNKGEKPTSFRKPDNDSRELEKINAKLDRIMKALKIY